MSRVDQWTDDHIETALRLLTDAERLVQWHTDMSGYNGPGYRPAGVDQWLKELKSFMGGE